MLRFLLLLLALFATVDGSSAEEIEIVTCDVLPVVQVRVSGTRFNFLLDTAATSILNVKSFAHGDEHTISVTSWSGTSETRAQQVTISDHEVGEHHLRNLVLPAIDLSAIGRSCGWRLDGVLGIDLLRKLGAVVDLKARSARLSVDVDSPQKQAAELQERLLSCARAFNRGDEAEFSDCLDPDVVLFTTAGDFYGRQAALEFYRQRHFPQNPSTQLAIKPRVYHLLGDAIWIEYELSATIGRRTIVSRGTALCHKADAKWRIIHLNCSARP
jgi:ketosteroid isomerase-like protein